MIENLSGQSKLGKGYISDGEIKDNRKVGQVIDEAKASNEAEATAEKQALIKQLEKSRLVEKILSDGVKSIDLIGANLTGADLINANLRNADLIGADLIDADLIGADMINANLTGADLIGANLSGANLKDADLIGADLSGAKLIGTDLNRANLYHADLRGADLNRANLYHVEVNNAIFGNNQGISEGLKQHLMARGAKFIEPSPEEELGNFTPIKSELDP